MSVFTLASGLFAVKPKVWTEYGRLMASSSTLGKMCSLFSSDRLVCVDKRSQTVTIQTKRFWFITKTRVIKFDRIKRIDYSFGSFTTDWDYHYGATDQMESFTVSLCLEKPEAVGHCFNIGSPKGTVTVYGLALAVVRVCKSKSPIDFVPKTYVDVELRVPNIDKARRILGYDPKITLEEGLAKTYNWIAAQLKTT